MFFFQLDSEQNTVKRYINEDSLLTFMVKMVAKMEKVKSKDFTRETY